MQMTIVLGKVGGSVLNVSSTSLLRDPGWGDFCGIEGAEVEEYRDLSEGNATTCPDIGEWRPRKRYINTMLGS